jgi:uncharacterized protein
MRPTRALWAYLLYVFVGSAVVAPWIFSAMQHLGFTNVPFRRVVDRCLLVLALIGLWPFVKSLGIKSAAEIGLRGDAPIGRDLFKGIVIGAVLLALAASASVLAGASNIDHSRSGSAWGKQIGSALATAIVVALLEEILFRGAIFTALRRTWNDTAALWVSSAIYGILHFLGRPENPTVIEWNSGFVVLARMLNGFTELQTVVPGFFSLTLLGVVFALAFQRSGALFLSMGIHGALVFCVKLFGFATNAAPGANRWFWGTEKLVDGWFCFLLLIGATAWFARKAKPTASP